MQLDRTEIVIRQRTALELFDLSVLVLKQHAGMILLTCAVLGVPLLALDVFAIHWMMGEEAYLVAEQLPSPEFAMRGRYISHLILLFVMQFPIISLPVTVYLGNQIFFEKISLRSLLIRLAPIAWRSLLVLGVVRLGLVGLFMEYFVERSVTFDLAMEFWLLFVVSLIGLILRACYPFAPEIFGLELCKLRTKSKDEITYAQRSRGLHRQLLSEHFMRFIAAGFFSVLLSLMLLGTVLFFQGTFLGDWQWNRWYDFLILPLVIWLVGTYIAVFRFLSYIDTRIRLEGWEIELRLRAEALRLMEPNRVNAGTNISDSSETSAESRLVESSAGKVIS
ncbi:MAG: hypothetical protein R3C53_15315 [Pirellulaceae bacterium]